MSDKPVLTGEKAKAHKPFPAVMAHYDKIPREMLDGACKRAYGPEWQYSYACGDCETIEKQDLWRVPFRMTIRKKGGVVL